MENFPLAVRIFILVIELLVIPAAAGGCLQGMVHRDLEITEPDAGGWAFRWAGGQMLLWAGFQILCVPCVLRESSFRYVVRGFEMFTLAMAVVGLLVSIRGRRPHVVKTLTQKRRRTKAELIFWAIAGGLFLLQMVQAVRLAYGDGDDAYYVAVSSITENAETMYLKLPYTGGSTDVDVRHGLAPFPIWIAFLARVSGIRTVSVAHIAVPLTMIPMSYVVYYLLGRRLLAGKEKLLSMFMSFVELLVLFGDYSFYTVENFMLARSRQGKSALGCIIIPMLFLLLLLLLEKMQENKKCSAGFWILLACIMIAGCLCSTMGAFLLCLLLAVSGLCAAICYRNWRVLVPLALCCLPCVYYAVLYIRA
jgi:hypothetical protein